MAGTRDSESEGATYMRDFKALVTLDAATNQATLQSALDALDRIDLMKSKKAAENRIFLLVDSPGAVPGDLTFKVQGQVSLKDESEQALTPAVAAGFDTDMDPVATVNRRIVKFENLFCGKYKVVAAFTGNLPNGTVIYMSDSAGR